MCYFSNRFLLVSKPQNRVSATRELTNNFKIHCPTLRGYSDTVAKAMKPYIMSPTSILKQHWGHQAMRYSSRAMYRAADRCGGWHLGMWYSGRDGGKHTALRL